MVKNKKDLFYYFLCLGLVIFHITLNFWWLKVDNELPPWDPAWHFLNSLKYAKLLSFLSFNSFSEVAKVSYFWPPFIGLITAPFITIFKKDIDTATLIMNLIFFPILIFSIFKIGKRVCSPNAGMLSAFLVSMYPGVIALSRHYNLDLPLIAISSLAFYNLLLTEKFTVWCYSLIFGFIMGIGLLTKQAFIFFIIAPLLYIFIHLKSLRSFKIALISLFIAVMVASFWYIPNFNNQLYQSKQIFKFGHETFCIVTRVLFSCKSLLYYIIAFINQQGSFIYFLMFLFGLLFYIKQNSREKVPIYMWLIGPYIILIYILWRDPRYAVSSLVPISLITSIGLMNIKNSIGRNTLCIFIVAYSFIQFLANTWNISFLPQNIKFPKSEIIIFSQEAPLSWIYHLRPKVNRNWQIEDIIREIQKDNKNIDSPVSILVLATHPVYNPYTLGYYSEIDNLRFTFEDQAFTREISEAVEAVRDKKILYIIYKDNNSNVSLWNQERIEAGYQWIKEHPQDFISIFQTKLLADNSKVIIYKRVE